MGGFNLNKLLRKHIASITPYSSARDEFTGKADVYLDANENALGSVIKEDFSRYPDPYQSEVKAVLSKLRGVSQENIFLGNGSDEPIDLLIRVLCEPGNDAILQTPPTYGMYGVSAELNNAGIINVPLIAESFQLNVDEIIKRSEDAKIVFLCSPNNPTGNAMHYEDIQKVIEGCGCVVVVDEAYIDFSAKGTFATEVEKYPNLVVLQTFSKAWGLAALRLGMAYASKELIDVLNKVKPPYNINGYTQDAALRALSNVEEKDDKVKTILAERELMIEVFAEKGYVKRIYDSDANFLLIKVAKAHETYRSLIHQGVIVRDRSKVLLCDDCLRITIGTPEENQILINALDQIYS